METTNRFDSLCSQLSGGVFKGIVIRDIKKIKICGFFVTSMFFFWGGVIEVRKHEKSHQKYLYLYLFL